MNRKKTEPQAGEPGKEGEEKEAGSGHGCGEDVETTESRTKMVVRQQVNAGTALARFDWAISLAARTTFTEKGNMEP